MLLFLWVSRHYWSDRDESHNSILSEPNVLFPSVLIRASESPQSDNVFQSLMIQSASCSQFSVASALLLFFTQNASKESPWQQQSGLHVEPVFPTSEHSSHITYV